MPLNIGFRRVTNIARARRLIGHEQTILIVLAIATGLAASLAATAFREVLSGFQWLAFARPTLTKPKSTSRYRK
jgi:hypothetical protein